MDITSESSKSIFSIIDNGFVIFEVQNNGDIIINNKVANNDLEIVSGLKKFLKKNGYWDK